MASTKWSVGAHYFEQQALTARPRFSGSGVIASLIPHGLGVFFQNTHPPVLNSNPGALSQTLSRREVNRLLAWILLAARYLHSLSLMAASAVAQSPPPTIDSHIRTHVRDVWRWIYCQINPETKLAYSHPGDARIAHWSVTYDNALRIMGHIQTGDLARATEAMNYFLTNPSIRRSGEWIVNVIDGSSPNGLALESIAHTGPNAYLGIAAVHLYEAMGQTKYLDFARERWALIKGLENENPTDLNYGGVRMGPRGDPHKPTDQKLDYKAENPSWYEFYNTEHNADFKALSDLLYHVDHSSSDRQKYLRTSELLDKWNAKVFDRETNLFY